MQPTFKIGDKAVYRNHGVAIITGIETIEMYGNLQNVYVLEVMDSKRDRVMIPVDKVNSVGLRSLISQEEVDEVYEILRERPGKFDQQTWNRRQRKYTEKINTGSVYDVAEVLRDLYLLKFDKTLSFGEKRMLDRAQQLLVKELAIARDKQEADVEIELAEIFADAIPPAGEGEVTEEAAAEVVPVVMPEPPPAPAKPAKAGKAVAVAKEPKAAARPKSKAG